MAVTIFVSSSITREVLDSGPGFEAPAKGVLSASVCVIFSPESLHRMCCAVSMADAISLIFVKSRIIFVFFRLRAKKQRETKMKENPKNGM